ncbi:unnamed protein product [Cylicocyclus nassatus]|uniref:Uncharacterized protein n=1 Tax=Cylicocyclus nassatus TaxID=53992 RepID=A0AA36H985_CYLNA|nr:unnamed protein product [Cylicocyclus nassatus]
MEQLEEEEPGHFDYKHLQELNHALEVERNLVLKAHDNYRSLKQKFIELREEHESLQNEMDAKVIAHNQRLESMTEENEKLNVENDILREEVQRLKDELKKMTKDMKVREEEMKRSFSDQIEKLLEETTREEGDEFAKKEEELRRNHILDHDDKVHELLAEIQQLQAERDEEVRMLRAELNDEHQMRIELTSIVQSTKTDLDLARNAAALKHSESIALRSELNRCLKEDMEKEIDWMTKEDNFRKTLLLRTTSFEQKANDFQRAMAEKDELIAGLRLDVERLQASLKESRRQQAENDKKSPPLPKEEKDDSSQAVIEQLKRERNNLEVTVAELKKQLESSPETAKEVKRLKELLEDKTDKLATMQRSYRQLMRKVEHSLVHLEKQHLKTRRKLEENILS